MEELDKYYFAYGININEAYMNARCGNENYSAIGFAFLLDYEQIVGGGIPAEERWGGGGYGIIPSIGKVVFGICYRINDKALSSLDIFESATESSNPKMYERKQVEIFIDGLKFNSFAYISSDFFIKTKNDNISIKYRDEIIAGFHRHLMQKTKQTNIDSKEISSMKYLEELQSETEKRGRHLRRLAKVVAVSIPVVIGTIVFFTRNLDSYFCILLCSIISILLVVLAKMLFNEGAAFGARCGKFEDMIYYHKLFSDIRYWDNSRLIELFTNTFRDPSIMKLIGKAGDIQSALEKLKFPL